MPDDEEYVDEEYLAEPEEREDPEPEPPKRQPRTKPTPQEKAATQLPIAGIETAETLHGEVRMTRSLSLGSRNDVIHFSVALPVVVQEGWTLAQQAVAAADTAGIVKSIVYSQLGLDFTVTEDGVLMEVLKAFPGAERVQEREEELGPYGRRKQHDDNGEPPRRAGFPHPADLDRPDHVDREVWADLCEHYSDWYDNRRDKASGKYKDTAPDFKRAEDSETIWLRPFRKESSRSSRGGGGRGYQG
jgi:hypothetical protein